jgi:hypothetical protein
MDLNDEKLIEIFSKKIRNKIKFNDEWKSRKATEEEYFYAYLIFMSNSVTFTRFKFYNERTSKYITGKYLNEKVNYWIELNIFNEIYLDLIEIYKLSVHPSVFKYLSVDTLFVPNRFCSRKDSGRCVYYKSKFGLKINFIVDILGTPINISIAKGNENDSTIAIKEIHKIATDVDSKKYINSNKYKRNIIGDKIYDSENFKNKCYDNSLVPIVDYNKRNTKDPIKLKNKKLNDHKLSIYNRRKIVENSFAWETQHSPRFYRVFSRKPNNFLNEVLLIATKIILKRI